MGVPTEVQVIEAGKASRKDVRRLKRGRGRLARKVLDEVDAVAREMGPDAEGKVFVPVVVVYKKKLRKRSLRWPFFL